LLLGCTILILSLFALVGCTVLRANNSGPAETPDSTPSPELTPAGGGLPGDLESSIALVRPAGEPEQVLGSAVVITPDGLLITALGVLEDDIEVVLPDGSVYRPALVSVEPVTGLAMLKVPAERLVPVSFSTYRPADGTEVFATGYDGTPGTLGRMSGEVATSVEAGDWQDYRVRGSLFFETDINLVTGFRGGALSDHEGGFSGVLIPSANDEDTARAATHWFVRAWLDSRENRLDDLSTEAARWERMELPGRWEMREPDGWSTNVAAHSEDTYRAELTPGDPDVPLQLAISVEPNQYGTSADDFIEEVFEDRSSARIWSVSQVQGRPLVRVTISEEGALVDLAYVLDEMHLIAVSLRSGYQPREDHVQVDEVRALFETVIDSIQAP
jgi:hypothetical protein